MNFFSYNLKQKKYIIMRIVMSFGWVTPGIKLFFLKRAMLQIIYTNFSLNLLLIFLIIIYKYL